MRADLILAIDQGTSATKCMLVDAAGLVVALGSASLGESTPHPGWVEQDADAIWRSVREAVDRCLDGQDVSKIIGVAIANQRESVLIWERESGKPLSPVLNWRDNRTGATVDAMRTNALEADVFARSGLPLDSMFSASKARWLLDTVDPDRKRAAAGELVIGTIDAFIVSRFGGELMIEIGNASRTQLLNVTSGQWDPVLCELFGVPLAALPKVVHSTFDFGAVRDFAPVPDGTPVLAVLGDSHAALFAHGAFEPGPVKATFGTGSSIMGLVNGPIDANSGVCLTIAWADEEIVHAAEGNIRSSGATLRWAADLLGMSTNELVALAEVSDAGGVSIIPGFTGLGAPWWDRGAVGLISNLSVGTGRGEIARAALESIPHQIMDVVEAMDAVTGGVTELYADGGPTRNNALMQLMADIGGRPIRRSNTAELSALGAAHLAGLKAGIWDKASLKALPCAHDSFIPLRDAAWRTQERRQWHASLRRARMASHSETSKEVGSP